MKHTVWIILVTGMLQSCIETVSRGGDDEEPTQQEVPAEQTEISNSTHEATSLLGVKLFRPPLSRRDSLKRSKQLNKAKTDYDSDSDNLENIIWYGRRLAYLYNYKESINIYSEGLKKFPESYRLYRHRGHRYISIRQFDNAIADLERAAFYVRDLPVVMEKDGLPNKRNIPRTSVQFNIWYHLGLAYYMKGNFDKAISAYKKCLGVSDNDDMLVAATDWFYMTYRKIGNLEAAEALLEPISRKMSIMENYSYHNRLLMYKGLKKPENLLNLSKSSINDIDLITQGYGVGNWYYYNGEVNKAIEIFEKIIEAKSWHAFGYIAAEAELANIRQARIL